MHARIVNPQDEVYYAMADGSILKSFTTQEQAIEWATNYNRGNHGTIRIQCSLCSCKFQSRRDLKFHRCTKQAANRKNELRASTKSYELIPCVICGSITVDSNSVIYVCKLCSIPKEVLDNREFTL